MTKWKQLRDELGVIQDNLEAVRDGLVKIQVREDYPQVIRDKAGRIHSALGIDVDELGRMIGSAHKE